MSQGIFVVLYRIPTRVKCTLPRPRPPLLAFFASDNDTPCVTGLTAQNYAELAVLYKKHSQRGLEILGFPCNQFGSQEPGTNAEIQVIMKMMI